MSLTTYTGKTFDFNNITKESIDITDIIRSLPRLNRFVGHSSRAYSVAEHTILCTIMAFKLGYSRREQFLTFIHDFTEAYCGDCPAPLKEFLPQFKQIEKKVEHAILDYFGIDYPTEEEHWKIKRIDRTMLVIEMKEMTLHSHEKFIDDTTYTEMLEHVDLQINHKEPNEEVLNESLLSLLETLLEDKSLLQRK